jgi:hypothetical protein
MARNRAPFIDSTPLKHGKNYITAMPHEAPTIASPAEGWFDLEWDEGRLVVTLSVSELQELVARAMVAQTARSEELTA